VRAPSTCAACSPSVRCANRQVVPACRAGLLCTQVPGVIPSRAALRYQHTVKGATSHMHYFNAPHLQQRTVSFGAACMRVHCTRKSQHSVKKTRPFELCAALNLPYATMPYGTIGIAFEAYTREEAHGKQHTSTYIWSRWSTSAWLRASPPVYSKYRYECMVCTCIVEYTCILYARRACITVYVPFKLLIVRRTMSLPCPVGCV
jgi:hypothetical protein